MKQMELVKKFDEIGQKLSDVESLYNELPENIKKELKEGFTGETFLHLRCLQQNINDLKREIKNGTDF